MDNRETILKTLRGETIGETTNSTSEEQFQNQTLRPILKLQNDLFIDVFRNHLNKFKNDFQTCSVERKMHYVDNAIQKDIKLRNALKGMVIALFTLEEYQQYIKNSSSLNKRMMNLLAERLKSQIQLFEPVATSHESM